MGRGLELKQLLLVLMVILMSSFTVLRRYSKGILKEAYSNSSVMAVTEMIKVVVCLVMVEQAPVAADKRGLPERVSTVFYVIANGRAMAVPAFIYLVMNGISYVVSGLLDATTFTMIGQLKPLTTCIFAKLVLGRTYSWTQWRSLFAIVMSVTIVATERGRLVATQRPAPASAAGTAADTGDPLTSAFVIGVALTVLEVTLSGFTTCYFEKYLKTGAVSVWGCNLQLGMWSLLVLLPQFIVPSAAGRQDGAFPDAPRGLSFFAGWSYITVLLAFLSAGGGLLVALVVKHADAVTKAVGGSLAVAVTVAAETAVLGTPTNSTVLLAAVIAMLSVESFREAGAPWPAAGVRTGAAVTSRPAPTVVKVLRSAGDDAA